MIVRTEQEVQDTITKLNERRKHPALKRAENEQVKAGFREALRVLCDKDEELQHIVDNCESVQARCIAWLAVDYLQGICDAHTLLHVPINGEKDNEQ